MKWIPFPRWSHENVLFIFNLFVRDEHTFLNREFSVAGVAAGSSLLFKVSAVFGCKSQNPVT